LLTFLLLRDSTGGNELEKDLVVNSSEKISQINIDNILDTNKYPNNLSRLIVDANEDVISFRADIRKDHRIFGFSEANHDSQILILFSVFTNDVEGNPFDATLGSYYDTFHFENSEITYLSKTDNFIKTNIVYPEGEIIVFFEREWVEFIDYKNLLNVVKDTNQ
jgi:hypothetical protein